MTVIVASLFCSFIQVKVASALFACIFFLPFCRSFVLFMISRIIYLAFSVGLISMFRFKMWIVHTYGLVYSIAYTVGSLDESTFNTWSKDIPEKYDSNVDKRILQRHLHISPRNPSVNEMKTLDRYTRFRVCWKIFSENRIKNTLTVTVIKLLNEIHAFKML